MNEQMIEYIKYLRSRHVSETSIEESTRLFCTDVDSMKKAFENRLNLFDECHK